MTPRPTIGLLPHRPSAVIASAKPGLARAESSSLFDKAQIHRRARVGAFIDEALRRTELRVVCDRTDSS